MPRNVGPHHFIPMILYSPADELRELEPIFHTPSTCPPGRMPDDVLLDDFWEVGASGRRYTRELVMKIVRERKDHAMDRFQVSDFVANLVAPNLYLVTYTLRQPDRVTRRMSLWRRCADGAWRLRYHQGTMAEEGDGKG